MGDIFSQGVRLLVDIGADVNMGAAGGSENGEGSEGDLGRVGEQEEGGRDQTPICLAVHSRMKTIVELLLDLGVTNVHSALKISRRLELDDITGILLKSIGLDRNGDSVNLSGLKLCSIRPQWILPSLGVSETLYRDRFHQLSFDRIKDMLMRRKSIGCIADKDLEALRAEMEGSNQEKESQMEGVRPGKDEPDSGVPESPQPRPGHRRSKSSTHTPSNWMDSIRELSTSPPDVRLPKRDRSVSLPPGEASEKNTAALTPQVNIHPEERQQHSSTPKKPRGSVSSIFQPTLTPIGGTPVNSLQRVKAPPKWTRESSGEWVDSPTSPTSPLSPGERRLGDHERRVGEGSRAHSSKGTLVTSMDSDPQQPRTPQRRHHNKMNCFVSPGDAKQSKLHAEEPEDDDTFQLLHVPMLPKQKFASVSPTLLLRKLSLWGKNHKSSHTSLSVSRTDSPPARIYVDFTAHSFSEESRDATPAPNEVPSKLSLHTSKVSSDEGVSTVPAASLPPNTSSILSPMSDTCSSNGDGVFSPTQSITVHSRRKPSFSSSTSVSRLEGQQRHDSVDGTRNYTVSYREERREKITTARLVRILDLSSNSLSQLEGMVGLEHWERDGERGELVLRRLKGLHRLDLKQNQLSRLPRLLMEGLKKLSILNLSCNHFDKMPPECVLSPALTYLNISSNRVGGVIVC